MEEVTLENYREILPQRWLEYLHALGSVEGKIEYLYRRNGKDAKKFSNEFICHYPMRADIRGPVEGGSNSAVVTGKDYWFILEREKPTDGWTIERILTVPTAATLDSWVFPQIYVPPAENYRFKDKVGYNIFNTLGVGLFAYASTPNLPDLFTKKEFKVNKAEFVEQDGKRQLFLDFDCTYSEFPPFWKQMLIESNELKVHPNWKPLSIRGQVWLETDYFLITKGIFHKTDLGNENSVTTTCEYDSKTYRVPLPKKYFKADRFRLWDKESEEEKQGVLEHVHDFDLRETNPKDAKRFTLSAFGIPEPDFAPRRMSIVRILLIALGGIMIVFALWMLHKREKMTGNL